MIKRTLLKIHIAALLLIAASVPLFSLVYFFEYPVSHPGSGVPGNIPAKLAGVAIEDGFRTLPDGALSVVHSA